MTRWHVSEAASPSERGVAFGRAFATDIARTLDVYDRLFEQAGVAELDLDLLGEEAMASIVAFAPAHAAEIEGMARGAGLAIPRVAALNARTEILARGDRLTRGECSAVVALRPGAGPVALQTWDWHEELADCWLAWTIPHPSGHVVHTLTEFGIVGKIGVSSARLGLLLNILHHEHDGERIGTPVHAVARRILDEAQSLDEALEIADAARVSASSAITLVAVDGHDAAAVTAELYPGGPGRVLPNEQGVLVHTNHFVSSPASLGDREPEIGPDSLVRYDILRNGFADRAPAAGEDVLAEMTNHVGAGGAICCHPDGDANLGERYATLATVLLDVAAGSLAVHPGGPCTADGAAWASSPPAANGRLETTAAEIS